MGNKKVRLYFNGKRQRDIYINKTRWEIFKIKTKRFLKRLLITVVTIAFLASIYTAGAFKEPKIVEVKVEVEKEIPVLDRIAKCESPTGHYKDGQVALYGNKNGSVDIGAYMINNQYWGKKASELHYDLMDENENKLFAEWLYRNYGSEPWSATKHCWSK